MPTVVLSLNVKESKQGPTKKSKGDQKINKGKEGKENDLKV